MESSDRDSHSQVPLTQQQAIATQSNYQDYYATYRRDKDVIQGPNPVALDDLNFGQMLQDWIHTADAIVPFDQITIRGNVFFYFIRKGRVR